MSFGGQQQFDEAAEIGKEILDLMNCFRIISICLFLSIERHIQEEFRRQQLAAANHHQALSALSHHQQALLGAEHGGAPYYPRPTQHGSHPAHPPFGRPVYGSLGAGGVDHAGAAYGIPSSDGQQGQQAAAVARLYAEQQRHHQHPPHGIPPAGYPYGHLPPHDPRYAPPPGYPAQAAAYSHEQQAAAAQRPPPPAYARDQPHHPRAPTPSAHPQPVAPGPTAQPPVPKSPISRQNSAVKLEESPPKPKSATISAGSPLASDEPESPASPGSPKPSASSGTPMASKLPQYRQVDNTILDESGEHCWYTGCVPLGLADDKYWLSELQVYLRSNFAEAFGATEGM